MYKVAGFQESILSREHINIAAMNCLHCPARRGTNSTCCLPHLAWPLPTDQRQSEGVGRALEQLENLGPRPGNFQLPGRASLANALTSLSIQVGNSQHSSDLHMGDCKYQMGQWVSKCLELVKVHLMHCVELVTLQISLRGCYAHSQPFPAIGGIDC